MVPARSVVQLDGLKGHGALVTGAGSSVGRVIAESFARAGARVHVADVNIDFIKTTLREVPALSGSVCDVGQVAQIEALFEAASAKVGEVDFLVNCVGIPGPAGP